ncbi:uncharacterized protein KGF55_002849 [Candida pseudojiufengensis]|uniref:uncharacterized protein n=1 Tax=Candida pseudojiufengensis TaxID=497109 RepID=UPI0022250879|nr:uncharacterized protein KGF55_002849 [Candida pseudojiufengensis]KAI5963057.1 hypothetical protein KGF55_002849 [Candida pseudojiufengensis]
MLGSLMCNERKPSCDYCIHTNRECVYPTSIDTKNTNYTPTQSQLIQQGTTTPVQIQRQTDSQILNFVNQTSSAFLTTESNSSTPISNISDEISQHYILPHRPYSQVQQFLFKQNPPKKNGETDLIDIKRSTPSVDNLTKTLLLNQPSSMLGISKFELRLLKYFDETLIKVLNYGINEPIFDAWKYKVPYLFLESDLVKRSLFAFTAVLLGEKKNLDVLQGEDNNQITSFKPERDHQYDLDLNSNTNFFKMTTTYFLNSLEQAQIKIDEAKILSENSYFQNSNIAKELFVSSLLIFSFLSSQPYGLIKLISFEEGETDLISIGSGTRSVFSNVYTTILKSDFAGMLDLKLELFNNVPSAKDCGFPIINYLWEELTIYSDNLELNSENSEIIQILKEVITSLTKALYASLKFKFPIPIFRALMEYSSQYKQLLYQKHHFASKILFVHASLTFMLKCHIDIVKNIWKEYILWYKQQFGLSTEIEISLFDLVVSKNLIVVNFYKFPFFDPNFVYFDPIKEYKEYKSNTNL